MGNSEGIFLIDLPKCSEDEKGDLVWLALAQYLDGKKCAVCGHIYDSRESVNAHKPIGGFRGDVVGESCWQEYLETEEGLNELQSYKTDR